MKDVAPPFLGLESFRLSNTQARKILIDSLLSQGIKSPKGGWEKNSYTHHSNGESKTSTFRELLEKVKEHGYDPISQSIIDNNDRIFGGNWGMTTPTMGFIKVESTYAGFTKSLTPPMTNVPVEYALAKDILFYRKEACIYSDEYDFEMCTRYYRAYLTACISLVDAFINRHILIYEFEKVKSDILAELKTTSRLEDKMGLFISLTANRDLEAINSGIEWTHFKKLRRLRNEMVHVNEPSLGYSIHEFADHLNFVRKGIGGLLRLMRRVQGKPTLGFIESLHSAPVVYFNEITHKEDGNHIIKRRY